MVRSEKVPDALRDVLNIRGTRLPSLLCSLLLIFFLHISHDEDSARDILQTAKGAITPKDPISGLGSRLCTASSERTNSPSRTADPQSSHRRREGSVPKHDDVKNTDAHKQNATNPLPPPGNDQNQDHQAGGDQVHQKCQDGLPKAIPFTKNIQGKDADKAGAQNRDDPRSPVQKIGRPRGPYSHFPSWDESLLSIIHPAWQGIQTAEQSTRPKAKQTAFICKRHIAGTDLDLRPASGQSGLIGSLQNLTTFD